MAADIPDIPAVERYIVEMTNALRHERQLGEVHVNAELSAAAAAYAKYLAKTNAFSHTADGREAGDRAKAAGYAWCTIGENLAAHLDSRGFQSRALAKQAVEGWLNSPGHKENMLAPHATEIGVGVARAPDEHPKYIAVQLLARPKSLSYRFQISNATKEALRYTFSGETHDLAPGSGVRHEACLPSDLTFDRTKGGSKTATARYEARDGLVYVLKTDPQKGFRVDVEPFESVR